jgi:hypothetical protein
MKVITRYNEIRELRLKNHCKKVSDTIKVERINISERGVRNIAAEPFLKARPVHENPGPTAGLIL